jgi:hypothetical protein
MLLGGKTSAESDAMCSCQQFRLFGFEIANSEVGFYLSGPTRIGCWDSLVGL